MTDQTDRKDEVGTEEMHDAIRAAVYGRMMDSGIAAHIADRIDAHDSLLKERDELKHLYQRANEGLCDTRHSLTTALARAEKSEAEAKQLREEVERAEGSLADMVNQFAYPCERKDGLFLSTGGLSALEGAFDVLGYDDPKPCPERNVPDRLTIEELAEVRR